MDLAAERAYPTPLANSPLLPMLLLSLMRQKNAPVVSGIRRKEYDYIIVGAGSAGSTLANRLTEVSCVNVLLLEAGKSPPVVTEVPAFYGSVISSDIDWQFKTIPQRHTGSGLLNGQVPWPSGKALGGSSVLNSMHYVRGNRKNYDDWADQGAKGWSYEEVLPYFIKSEDNRNIKDLDKGFHGTGGPVTVEKPRYSAEMKAPILEAARNLGYDLNDPNGKRQTGFYDPQYTMRDNQRCSTAKAYLVPAENRTNLDILTNTFVKKIVIEGGRATGVIYGHANTTVYVKARREVILSAGAVNSAQLLMLSGIGHRRHLEELGIPVLADLPVGDNLQDHCGAFVSFALDPKIRTLEQKVEDENNIAEYIDKRSGPLTALGVSYISFLGDDSASDMEDHPNYQLYFFEGTTGFLKNVFGIKPEVYQQVYEPYENRSLMVCFVQQLQPKSRGSILLHSADPRDPPLIDPNYLADKHDIQDLVQGMKTCNKIGKSESLRKIGSQPLETVYPGCLEFVEDEDKYFTCQVKSVVASIYHKVGTVKMGDAEDPTTVVDPQLRVKGVDGLRVVDASVMPIITSGNTNAPTIMIAEKASDIIKRDITDCRSTSF